MGLRPPAFSALQVKEERRNEECMLPLSPIIKSQLQDSEDKNLGTLGCSQRSVMMLVIEERAGKTHDSKDAGSQRRGTGLKRGTKGEVRLLILLRVL